MLSSSLLLFFVLVLVDVVILSFFALITIIISKFPLAKIPLPGDSVSDHVIVNDDSS